MGQHGLVGVLVPEWDHLTFNICLQCVTYSWGYSNTSYLI